MTRKLVRLLMAAAFAFSITAVAQSATPDNALPSAPGAPAAAPTSGTRIGLINLEGAIYASNEGQRDFEALSKKLEPKQSELKGMNDELEALKKQLSAQGEKLNDDARGNLVRQVDAKQKVFDRTMQDARDDAQAQNSEIAQKILQKLGPVLVKYAQENGYGVIIDTSKQWPDGPVIWNGGSMDITRAIVEAYNVQSGVPAPTPSAGAKPAAPRSSGTGAKPATSTTPKQP
jgi:outer membrane protein